jgi:hypothetical protein
MVNKERFEDTKEGLNRGRATNAVAKQTKMEVVGYIVNHYYLTFY